MAEPTKAELQAELDELKAKLARAQSAGESPKRPQWDRETLVVSEAEHAKWSRQDKQDFRDALGTVGVNAPAE